jgi:acyl-CoA thioester hydrolase
MGHMNVTWYVNKFDEATWSLLDSIGITPSYLQEGHAMAGVQQNITYKRELFPGDIVEIHSHVESIRERSLVFVYEMRDASRGDVCATCELTAVHMDGATRKPAAFPAEVRSLALQMLGDRSP